METLGYIFILVGAGLFWVSFVGLWKPQWFGSTSRGKAFGKVFFAAFAIFFIGGLLVPSPAPNEADQAAINSPAQPTLVEPEAPSSTTQRVNLDKVLQVAKLTLDGQPAVNIYLGGDDTHHCDLVLNDKGWEKASREMGYRIEDSSGTDLMVSCNWNGYHVLSSKHYSDATVWIYTDGQGKHEIQLSGRFIQVNHQGDIEKELIVNTGKPLPIINS